MKNLTLLLILLMLLFAGAAGVAYSLYKKEKAAREVAENNVYALRQDTTIKAASIEVKRKEFAELYRQQADKIEALGYNLKRVQQAHVVKYSIQHDTIAKTDTVYKVLHANETYKNTFEWDFYHGCLHHVVTYTEGDYTASDTIFGEIEITRVVSLDKPKWIIFKPWYWNKKSWPKKVTVHNNCGFEIKENTIFDVK